MGQSLHSNKLETSRHADKTGSKQDKSREREKKGAVIPSLFAAPDLFVLVLFCYNCYSSNSTVTVSYRAWEVTCRRKKNKTRGHGFAICPLNFINHSHRFFNKFNKFAVRTHIFKTRGHTFTIHSHRFANSGL